MKSGRDDEKAAALVAVLGDSPWMAVGIAKGLLALFESRPLEDAVTAAYKTGAFSRKQLRDLLPRAAADGLVSVLEPRTKTGSAENPITKLFPAVITEERFKDHLDVLLERRSGLSYDDNRASHSLVDFTIKETATGLALPINIKNAGTRFRRAADLVGLDPDDCIPIPAYKAFGAIDAEPNLLYAVCIDLDLVSAVGRMLPKLLTKDEAIVWQLLGDYVGARVKSAEDAFVLAMVKKHWEAFSTEIPTKPYQLISARRAIRILQTQPKRTPGIGLRAWGTGASAEVNVHISVSGETAAWDSVAGRIVNGGVSAILGAINRKIVQEVYDPEI